jgi:hypothetical protein
MIERVEQDDVGLKTTPFILFRVICWLKTVLRSFPWLREPSATGKQPCYGVEC